MDVVQQYTALLPKLTRILAQVAQTLQKAFSGGFVVETGLKTASSISRKCQDKECRKIDQLSDLIRGRLYFPQSWDYQRTLHKLIGVFGSRIKKIDWKKSRDYGLEYRGIVHVDLIVDGIKFELQVIPLGFKPFVEPQHKIYTMLRDGVKMDQATKKQLMELHNQMFDMLESRYM